MSQPLRLLIAANHPSIASGLVRKVRLALGREVEAETITALVQLRVRMRTANLPRLVLVDCALHGFDRRETLGELHLDRPEARLVALTQRDSVRDEAELVRAGARAVLSWSACPRLTARVLEIVAVGSSYMSTAALLAICGGGAASAARGPASRSHRRRRSSRSPSARSRSLPISAAARATGPSAMRSAWTRTV
jgi:DNA-binding NarL/FixJ family response regulator